MSKTENKIEKGDESDAPTCSSADRLILPCPFCGCVDLESGDNWSCGDGYVHCSSCGVTMSSETEESAINKWNTLLA